MHSAGNDHRGGARFALALLLATCVPLVQPGCESAPPTVEQELFAVPGARTVLRAESKEERAAIAEEAEFLAANYGFKPSGDLRLLRNLRDLIDRSEVLDSLHREPALAFGRGLAAIGHDFDPAEAVSLAQASAGSAGAALADPEVERFLALLLAEGALHEDAGADMIRLRKSRAEALLSLAADPTGAARVRTFAAALPFRFRPSDAAALIKEAALEPDSPETAFMRALVNELGVEARPGYLPELRLLAQRPKETRAFMDLAKDSEVRLAGPSAILGLSRVLREGPFLTDDERARFRDLAARTAWPDADDLASLATLARTPGSPELVADLADRYRYRFDPRDARGLARLSRVKRPDPELPAWVVADRVPLERPGLLLSREPATAFAGPNDLEFMSGLAKARPELVRQSRDRLERDLVRRLVGRPRQFRLGAPYPETATELQRFLRPDLLKAHLVLDALEQPEIVALFLNWLDEDVRDRGGEMGGYVRLLKSGEFAFSLFEGAASAGRDDRLLLPPKPVEAALDFHFHATDEDDAAFAGPSSGGPGTDLFRAARHRLDGLVFTRLADRRFNVDLYTSGEIVLDLGVYEGGQER